MITAAIQQKIEARFGKQIRYSKDCEALAVSINKFSQDQVSVTTLKRIFGFAKSVEQPRLYTLDVIAAYLGYNDWSSLLANLQDANVIDSTVQHETKLKAGSSLDIHLLHHQVSISLTTQSINVKKMNGLCRQFGKHPEIFPFIIKIISIAAYQKNVQFLKQVFDLPNIYDEKNHGLIHIYYIGQAMGMLMRSHPDMAEELTEPLSANTNAQKYFIEWFVDEDYLHGYYGKLLDAYHRHKHSEVQDKLFYFSLKYSQAIQAGNVIQRLSCYKKIKGLKIPTHLHEIPAARFIGICLAEESGHVFNATSPYYRVIQKYVQQPDHEKAIAFALYLSRELFRSMRSDWLVQVMCDFDRFHGIHPKKVKTHLDTISHNELNIYKTYAILLQGDKRKADLLFKTVDPNLFDPFIYHQMHHDFIYVGDKLKEK